MKRKSIIVSLIVVALTGLIGWKLAANKRTLNQKNEPRQQVTLRIPVKIAIAEERSLNVSILKTGNLSPFKEAKVRTTYSGTIRSLRFGLGTKVSQGQVLALMDDHLLQLDLQKSETAVAKLKNDLQTYTELLEGKATTQEKVNEIRQNYTDALNQYSQLRKQLFDAAVKAPTSGIISDKPIEEGTFANAGTEIATIVNLSKSKVQVYLTETEVYQVTEGQPVSITTDVYPGKVFPGTVSFISPQADASHSYMVEIMISSTGGLVLRSGTFVYADFSRKTTRQILLIPREALTEGVQQASVYVVDGGVARLKNIKAGREVDGMIAITEGLQKGDRVVTSGQINLQDSTAVSVSK